MAGDAGAIAIANFLSGLVSETVTPDRPLRLRSVQAFALRAWARREGVPLNVAALASTSAVSARQLAGGSSEAGAAPSPEKPAARVSTSAAGLQIGIDIEEVANLPHADDFREHPFYRDNFTPAEISHCLLKADTRASLCGLWAAKEAMIKAGVAAPNGGGLRTLEVEFDGEGRPFARSCNLSISHTPTTAVAVCIAAGEAP